MSELLSHHARDFRHFVNVIEKNPQIYIAEAEFSTVILEALGLQGHELRPLTSKEIDDTFQRYKFFWKSMEINRG